ncbi:MAG TPA: hypothetical protein VMN57_13270 [Anaerolineales bacterium]|nr:hypothetical protein [Anaerolineales bacterium]
MLDMSRPELRLRPGWPHPVHDWLRRLELVFVGDLDDPILGEFMEGLKRAFTAAGHSVLDTPKRDTKIIATTGRFGEPVNWRNALLFTGRRRYDLDEAPVVITAMHATHARLQEFLDHFARVIPKSPPDPADYDFPGLSPHAYQTLYEQGSRGGPLMALTRLLQSQSKSIRILLVIGDKTPEYVRIIDLVGAFPRVDRRSDDDYFYTDIMLRLATVLSTEEITNHEVVGPVVPKATWEVLAAPRAMQSAALELGKRNFFTEMVLIANLVHVPSISDSVASQYSEGCFATWEPDLDALIATVTGSARPVSKDAITGDDLAVIVGVKPDGSGAIVAHVEGKVNDPPSSESVEMMEMDAYLPRIRLPDSWGIDKPVPVVRSKLHGHRGVASFDPSQVEFVPLEPAYYQYPVSCATEAQARAIVNAFRTSEALQNPEDPRAAVFTVLPGHGLVVVEKWVHAKPAFAHLYELMDRGALVVDNFIPQGEVRYRQDADGVMELVASPLEVT